MRKDELTEWLESRIEATELERDMKAYVFNVLDSFRQADSRDMSNESVVLVYADAVRCGSFVSFQRVADWSLFVASYAPQSLVSPDVVNELGMRSYDACDRLMNRQWPVFSRLASEFPFVVTCVRKHVFG